MHFNHSARTNVLAGHREAPLAAVYALAGFDLVDHSVANLQALKRVPRPAAVADQIAHDALTTADPEEFLTRALDRLRDAVLVDALPSDGLYHALKTAKDETRPERIDNAIAALRHLFDDAVQALEDAADTLGTDAPLAVDPLERPEAVPAIIAARDALRALATFANLSPVAPEHAGTVHTLRRIITVDGAVLQLRAPEATKDDRALNEPELKVTRAVRRLAADLEEDADTALVRIAAGRYAGVSFHLNDHEEDAEAGRAINTAHRAREVGPKDAPAPQAGSLDKRREKLKADGRAARARQARAAQ